MVNTMMGEGVRHVVGGVCGWQGTMQLAQDSVGSNECELVYSHSACQTVGVLGGVKDFPPFHRRRAFSGLGHQGGGRSVPDEACDPEAV